MTQAFSKIWIIVIIIIVVFLGSGILLAKSSVLKIPVFSDIFYQKRISDLGIQSSPEAALNLEQKLFKGLAPLMRPAGWLITDIEITDVELTSWVNLICSEKREKSEKLPQRPAGPEKLPLKPELPSEEVSPEVSDICSLFENFQIQFKEGRYVASAHIFEPVEVDLTVFGRIFRETEDSIDLEFEEVYLGNIPLPKYINKEIEEKIELEINHLLRENLAALRIDSIEILDGKAVFKGEIEYGLGFKPKFCTKNEDCGIDTCQQGRDKCVEIKYICEMGKCVFPAKTTEFSSPPYRCWEGKCEAEEVIAGETADWKTYRNERHGFEFKYPAIYDEKEEYKSCRLRESINKNVNPQLFVSVASRVWLQILDPEGLTFPEYVDKVVKDIKIESKENISIGEKEAISISYRIPPSNAYGLMTLLEKDKKIYMFSLERPVSECFEIENISVFTVYGRMLSTFRFLE